MSTTELMEEAQSQKRVTTTRRVRPTPVCSRFWLRGRRRGGRREGETENIYIDRYEPYELFLVVGVLVLSMLDMIFTIIHLNVGGVEANPVMEWVLSVGGQPMFIAVKIASTLIGLFVLLIHVRFTRVRPLLTFAFILYVGIFVFHIYLGHLRTTGGGL